MAMVRRKVRTRTTPGAVTTRAEWHTSQQKGGDEKGDVSPHHENVAVGKLMRRRTP